MILVTGANGFVGHKIMQLCRDTVASPSLRGMTEEDIRRMVAQSGADTIIHTAAISDIGECAADPEGSYLANVQIPVWLAKASEGKKLICFSSDQVYSGMDTAGPYTEDAVKPGNIYAQHTDDIFSSIGEELGFFGCVFIMILELAIIARCFYVGIRCQDYMRRLVCFGAGSALMFQVMMNIGMCIGVMPVIGLTLPFFSYGASSVVTIFAMLGLVSGAHARPASQSHERYVQPYRGN